VERTRWPGTLGRDHDHVEIGPRLDLAEMDIEPVGEGERRALADIGCNLLAVETRLMLVGGQDHDHIGPGDGLLNRLDRETGISGLGGGGRAGAQTDHHRDAGVAQIIGMGMALRAVADDGDLLALDEREVGVFVVVNVDAHVCVPSATKKYVRK
jgi:hypothetical protein